MHKFVLLTSVDVPKLSLNASLYRHVASKHTHLHIRKTNDVNNVFALAFRTRAPDKTGVPHILEHTTLCGSQRYPVRDPFFKMLSRSLSNFMNAMTGADYTYYPFATTNKRDFFNLQQVYMDSVFRPLLRKSDFLQEGWRLEPRDGSKDSKDPESLEFKGVVYNEMKGQLSSPAYLFYNSWYEHVCPEMQCSGGDPLHIVDLKYADLKKFHADNYHANNCFTYSYGDFDASEAMRPLLDYIESSAETAPSDGSGKHCSRINFDAYEKRVAFGPVDPAFDESRQYKSSLTWFVPDNSCRSATLWRVLNMLLCDGHGSPIYKALIDSKLGFDFAVNSGIEEVPNGLLLTIGLQGMSKDNLDKFKPTVIDALTKVATDGLPAQRVEALLHQFELNNREVDANYGLNLLGSIVQRAANGDDFLPLLDSITMLDELRSSIEADPGIFKDMLSKFILSARAIEFEMHPLASFEQDLARDESQKLAAKLQSLTVGDTAKVYAGLAELQQEMQKPENLDVLPTLSTADIRKQIVTYPVSRKQVSSIDVVERLTSTGGISYTRVLRDLSALPADLYKYLPLYSSALTNIGTTKHTAAELEDLIRSYTGGISASSGLRSWGALEVEYSALALDRNLGRMYQILREVVREPNFENTQKLKVIVDASAANVTNSLSQAGHRAAIGYAAAQLNPRQAKHQLLRGVSFIRLVQQLAVLNETDLALQLVPHLKSIHNLETKYRILGISRSPNTDHTEHLESFLEGASSGPHAPLLRAAESTAVTDKTSVLQVPMQVSHVGCAVKACDSLLSSDSAALEVLAQLMTHKYLHPEIREKGGAYGGGASYNGVDGLFQMYSYRDPTPQNTEIVMRAAGDWAAQRAFQNRDVEEGKLGIFQSLDAPISPRSEISRSLYSQLTDEQRQTYRTNLINVEPRHLNEVAQKYLVPNISTDSAVCIVGPHAQPGYKVIEL